MKLGFAVLIATLLCGLCDAAGEIKTLPSAFNELFGSSSQPCYDACKRTFSLHTYDKPGNLEVCNRGCRFFSICEWADDDADFNNTVIECCSACDEAYNGTGGMEAESCKVGCKSAVSPAKERKIVLDKEEPRIHMFMSESSEDPFDRIFSQASYDPFDQSTDSMMQSMFNYISQLMQADFMMSSNDADSYGNIMIIQFNSPEINTQHPLDKQMRQNTDGNKIHSKTTLVGRIIESNLQTNLYESQHPYTGDYWIDSYDIEFGKNEYPSLRAQFQDWWNCFAKKADLPEIVLLLFWISTMILLVMCCTMQFPHKKSAPLSVDGDLAYIKESKGRIPEFLKVYGHPDVVQFTDVKRYKPDEKVPLLF